jgi:hypothetical protein
MILVLIVIFALFLVAGLSGMTRTLIKADKFPAGVAFGLRTPNTNRSDEAWVTGHRAATGALTLTMLVSGAGGLAVYLTSVFSPAGVSSSQTWIAAGISALATVAMIGIAFLIANSAASKTA